MAVRLRFNGVNNYCTFASTITVDLAATAYVFEAKLTLNAMPATFGGLLGRIGTSAGFFIMPSGALGLYTTGTQRFITNAGFFIAGENHAYRFEHDAGGAWRAYRDGVLFQSGTFSGSFTAAGLNSIGQGNNSDNSYCSMDLDYVLLSGPTNGQRWDADLSGGTGVTLPTQSGTNNATQAGGGWPSGDSEWITVPGGGTSYEGGAAMSFGVGAVGGGSITMPGGAAMAFGIDSSGAGLAERVGGAAMSFGIDSSGAGLAERVGGGLASFAFTSAGGGSITMPGGAAFSFAVNATGGGDIIPAIPVISGGAAMSFGVNATGGGVVLRTGGAALSFAVNSAGGGQTNRIGGAALSLGVDATGGGQTTRIGGAALSFTVTAIGGGIVYGPGYSTPIDAPTIKITRSAQLAPVRVVRAYSAAAKLSRTLRAPTCKI